MVEEARARRAPEEETFRPVVRPTPIDDSGFSISVEDGVFVVRGARPERWVRQTNFSNDEAVGYLADLVARLGVEEALARAGAEPVCKVRIADHEFVAPIGGSMPRPPGGCCWRRRPPATAAEPGRPKRAGVPSDDN